MNTELYELVSEQQEKSNAILLSRFLQEVMEEKRELSVYASPSEQGTEYIIGTKGNGVFLPIAVLLTNNVMIRKFKELIEKNKGMTHKFSGTLDDAVEEFTNFVPPTEN